MLAFPRQIIWLPLLLGIFIIYASVFLALTADPAPALTDPLPPLRAYPELTDLAPQAEITAPRFASLSYGVHTSLWWNSMYRVWDLDNMRQLNFYYAKESFAWDNIQPIPDVWKWHLADEVVAEVPYRGRRLIARIDTNPTWAIRPTTDPTQAPFDLKAFEIFCHELATRYRGQIEGYQIWNEPNLNREWAEHVPNAAAYTQLLAVCARAIRAADPQAIIISAGLAPTGTRNFSALPDEEFLWQMYEAGASAHFDVLGLHAPGYALPPEASAEEAAAQGFDRWARFRHVEDMRAIMVANGDAHKQIAITEMGWTTDNRPDSIYAWFGVDQETQADYLVRAYRYAAAHWRPWVGLMSVIYISKDIWTPDDEQWWWAIDEPAPPPIWKHLRPAYLELARMEKISDNPDFEQPLRDEGESIYLEPLAPRH